MINKQELIFRISDIIINIYSAESIILRIVKENIAEDAIAMKIAKVYCHDALFIIYKLLYEIFESIYDGNDLENNLKLLDKNFMKVNYDIVSLLRDIADKGIEINECPF